MPGLRSQIFPPVDVVQYARVITFNQHKFASVRAHNIACAGIPVEREQLRLKAFAETHWMTALPFVDRRNEVPPPFQLTYDSGDRFDPD